MPVSEQTVECRLVSYETSLPYDSIIGRLDVALSKDKSPTAVNNSAGAVWHQTNKEAIDALLPLDRFFFFNEYPHHRWLDNYNGTKTPRTTVYVIGNPRIAATMFKYGLDAGLHIPPRLLIMEKPAGTTISYIKPSSAVALPGCVPELREAAENVDAKLAGLLDEITKTG
ncbi:hypothetical protein BD626DRAFT_480700 [Schizophyllum amplum]|uniref:DUF302 domain-containing protein n=1 Tax=Schizophyllum amplum TaxID=97359 RepID=A0A550CTG8_9AGAR|nr:hypothetical protein BD626DRAFT_480700 [Auriculariopsis ampla]